MSGLKDRKNTASCNRIRVLLHAQDQDPSSRSTSTDAKIQLDELSSNRTVLVDMEFKVPLNERITRITNNKLSSRNELSAAKCIASDERVSSK